MPCIHLPSCIDGCKLYRQSIVTGLVKGKSNKTGKKRGREREIERKRRGIYHALLYNCHAGKSLRYGPLYREDGEMKKVSIRREKEVEEDEKEPVCIHTRRMTSDRAVSNPNKSKTLVHSRDKPPKKNAGQTTIIYNKNENSNGNTVSSIERERERERERTSRP